MAFQPIVDLKQGRIWGYEALVRGLDYQPASHVLDQVDDESVYTFDQACRVKAIELAGASLPRDGRTKLSINFKPNAVYEPAACIRTTLEAASRAEIDLSQLMFEFTEDEQMRDVDHLRKIIAAYQNFGFTIALDDFGAGFAGLSLLSDFQPDLIKLDMAVIRGIDRCIARQTIVHSIVEMTAALGVTCLAEGIETREEAKFVRELGIDLCQGFYFAKPSTGAFRHLRFEELSGSGSA
ncbi:EAL domain-containing protein [Erythrobacter sp.]|jgi:EAL domain-containing protein (putative c-di-GMP-specific phosphodiesterase class I)|uniref:EAL domain-containing protein n=1 Tax=Erythrobacter sp. TaxID=1042 RepID=UPI002EAFFD1D|nr:EAL domain-containing protein [Erythrobacter sp.]